VGAARGGLRRRKVAPVVLSQNSGIPVRPMASALLRRQLARKIALPRRCLFSSTSSVLAQAAPESQSSSSSSTTTPDGGVGKNVFNRHIAEELQGVTASEILAESGTRKDAQMRHFTGE
jgi:NADH dehydrogenase (ubiquinone) Fe-S protein 2